MSGRSSWGGHGVVSERQNGRMMMAIRPDPVVCDDEDVAMLLGFQLGILYAYRESNSSGWLSRNAVMAAVRDWENHNGKLTQKRALGLLTDRWYLAQYEVSSEIHETYNEDDEAHRAMLEVVHQIWPHFTSPTVEYDMLKEEE